MLILHMEDDRLNVFEHYTRTIFDWPYFPFLCLYFCLCSAYSPWLTFSLFALFTFAILYISPQYFFYHASLEEWHVKIKTNGAEYSILFHVFALSGKTKFKLLFYVILFVVLCEFIIVKCAARFENR